MYGLEKVIGAHPFFHCFPLCFQQTNASEILFAVSITVAAAAVATRSYVCCCCFNLQAVGIDGEEELEQVGG